MPVMNLDTAKQRLSEFQAFVKEYMVEGEDYGKIPGVSKPSLLKPGAEKLKEIYGLADSYPEEKIRRVENFDTGFFFYELTCVLTKKGTEIVIGEGKGSCNSYESRYRYRNAERKCPKCGQEAIIKGKEEYGGGWLCWAKKNGCGAKFFDNDPAIAQQEVGKVENDNLYDVMNTVLKMAKKRAMIDAVIGVTRSSGIFTQDVEDGTPPEHANGNGHTEPPVRHDVLAGILSDPKTDRNGALVFQVTSDGKAFPCILSANRKELIDQLYNAGGMHVELNYIKRVVDSGKNKGKTFCEVRSVIDIRRPITQQPDLGITDDDIPF
jgi:hypothetical protein